MFEWYGEHRSDYRVRCTAPRACWAAGKNISALTLTTALTWRWRHGPVERRRLEMAPRWPHDFAAKARNGAGRRGRSPSDMPP
jgi:hypothetical protein